MNRRFEEEVVEETTTEVVEEGTPDSHENFITLLTEMGLSAEQAEAIHQMAMDLIGSNSEAAAPSDGAEKVEASRERRSYGRTGRRSMGRGASRRRGMSRNFSEQRPEGRRSRGRNFNSDDVARMERTIQRQRRELSRLRKQIEGVSQAPGAGPVQTAPTQNFSAPTQAPQGGSVKSRVFEMMKSAL